MGRKRRDAHEGPVELPSSILELGSQYQVVRWRRQVNSLQQQGRQELESPDLIKQSATVRVGPADDPDVTREFTIGGAASRPDGERHHVVQQNRVIHRNEDYRQPPGHFMHHDMRQQNPRLITGKF